MNKLSKNYCKTETTHFCTIKKSEGSTLIFDYLCIYNDCKEDKVCPYKELTEKGFVCTNTKAIEDKNNDYINLGV